MGVAPAGGCAGAVWGGPGGEACDLSWDLSCLSCLSLSLSFCSGRWRGRGGEEREGERGSKVWAVRDVAIQTAKLAKG